jgi:hypothetical protein
MGAIVAVIAAQPLGPGWFRSTTRPRRTLEGVRIVSVEPLGVGMGLHKVRTASAA